MKRYELIARDIAAMIRSGSLTTGERVPSMRQLRRDRSISPGTVRRAYELLQERGYIEALPRSGFYVTSYWQTAPPGPGTSQPVTRSTSPDVAELIFLVLEAMRERQLVPFGSAFPSPTLFPLAQLGRQLGETARHLDSWSTVEDLPPGSIALRRQIALRYQRFGVDVAPEEIIVTAGALEAINLSLRSVTRPGDVVAIESPAFYGYLQAIETYGLRAVEIPTDPRDGVDLDRLTAILQRHPVRACCLMTTFQNPVGALMPDEKKNRLVKLLAAHEIPLIEDDVYSELFFGTERPRPAKAFDHKGLVLHCNSFSKCLAPGYRVGWVAAGRFARTVERQKVVSTIATAVPVQEAISAYLSRSAYERHLRSLRRALQEQQGCMLRSMQAHFPSGYRVTQPAGGYVLWVELPSPIDASQLHRIAIERGISLAPGPIFSLRREFRHCIRLNYGYSWDTKLEEAMRTLGELICELTAPVARRSVGRSAER
jgi:DNA-binding transcriptional MocR family regulator